MASDDLIASFTMLAASWFGSCGRLRLGFIMQDMLPRFGELSSRGWVAGMKFKEQFPTLHRLIAQPANRILLTLVSACMALSCLFPPWIGGVRGEHDYIFPLWNWIFTLGDRFLLSHHRNDKIDLQYLFVEWLAIGFSALFISGLKAMFQKSK